MLKGAPQKSRLSLVAYPAPQWGLESLFQRFQSAAYVNGQLITFCTHTHRNTHMLRGRKHLIDLRDAPWPSGKLCSPCAAARSFWPWPQDWAAVRAAWRRCPRNRMTGSATAMATHQCRRLAYDIEPCNCWCQSARGNKEQQSQMAN